MNCCFSIKFLDFTAFVLLHIVKFTCQHFCSVHSILQFLKDVEIESAQQHQHAKCGDWK